ncbi:glycosyltransferase family 4 protein [Candidatus Dependentiae bacterium]|nr:glycosyltransferase family 4 protein [Candidatus Dependentiae bacterium]
MLNLMFFNYTGSVGGPSKSLYFLLNELKTRDYNITVIVPNRGDLYNLLRNEGFKINVVEMPQLQIPKSIFEFISKFIISIFVISKLWFILIRDKIRIIHINSVILLLPVIAAKLAGKKVVVHVRETLTKNKIFNYTYLFIIGILADIIVGVSNAPNLQFKRLGFVKKLRVVFNGIKVREQKSIQHENRKLKIGMAAFFLPWKGHSTFLKSAIYLQKYEFSEDISFEIAGDLPALPNEKDRNRYLTYKNYLISIKDDYDKKNWIKFLGYQAKILDIMQTWDLIVIPSTCQDSSPRVILEAFSLGIPAVGADIGGIPDTIGEAGLIFKTSDHKDLGEKLKILIEDKELMKKLSNKARIRLGKYFTAEKHCSNMEKIFKELIHE